MFRHQVSGDAIQPWLASVTLAHMVDGHEMVTTQCIPNAHLLDYQWHKPLDIWSRALWLGAALEHMKARADEGDDHARTWIDRVPDEVKAVWPGIFPEYPYEGEPHQEHAARQARDG